MSEPYYADDAVTLYAGDCLDVLPTLPDNSVDAVVTDPPAGISFMGRDWDHHRGGREQWAAWLTQVMREAYRIAKPGAHALVWALPRTSHWTAIGIEDAGWEIRDRVTHLFGTGFPKSLDVSKAIDKAAGAEREVVGAGRWAGRESVTDLGVMNDDAWQGGSPRVDTAPATADAQRWSGWGTALKPAAEDWWLARKPLTGTVASNVLRHGTGALNIDGCRIAGAKPDTTRGASVNVSSMAGPLGGQGRILDDGRGRWPANVVLDEAAAAALDHMSGETVSSLKDGDLPDHRGGQYGSTPASLEGSGYLRGHNDSGGASRFYFTAKAGSDERPTVNGISHATVKPLSLMRWLVRLVTPPGGVILEPFAGSGTTVEAALLEGFRCVAIEREPDYLPLITQRINRRRDPIAYLTTAGEDLGLFGDST